MGFSLILRAFFSFPNERQFIECQFFWEFRICFSNFSKAIYSQKKLTKITLLKLHLTLLRINSIETPTSYTLI